MPPPLRVLSLTHVFPRTADDAVAPFLLRHLQGVAAAGVEVRVLAPHEAGLPDEHVVGGIRVRRVRYGADARETIAYRGEMHQLVRRPVGAWQAVRLVAALARAVRGELSAFAPDVLDVHWLVPGGVIARLATVGRDVPTLVNVHGTDVALVARGRLAAAVGRFALGGADQVAAMSVPLAAELEAVTGRRPDAVLPMPAAPPPAADAPPPADGPVLAVGRLVPEKGHHDLVDAVARLRADGREVTLTIVGDGPERDALAAHASRAGVPLDLPGAVAPEVLDGYYAAAAVVAVPSHREGFGLVAAEALARHRPVVASTAGGLAEIVTSDDEAGPTGWPVPPRDPAALAAALAEVLDDPDEAARRTAAGAARVARRWSPEALGRQAAERLAAVAHHPPPH